MDHWLDVSEKNICLKYIVLSWVTIVEQSKNAFTFYHKTSRNISTKQFRKNYLKRSFKKVIKYDFAFPGPKWKN